MSIELVALIALIVGIIVGAFVYLIMKQRKPEVKQVYIEKQPKPDTIVAAQPQAPKPTVIAKLMIIEKGFQRDYNIDKETVNIGREDDNEIILPDSDLTTGRYHARIRITKEGDLPQFMITDLDTKIGTKVGGKKLTQSHELKNNDLIEIGKTQMMFVFHILPAQQ